MPRIRAGELTSYFDLQGVAAGEPLVFIGGLGNKLQIWANQVSQFSRHYLVLTFDNRDAGLTEDSPRPNYHIVDMAKDTVDLLDALGIEKAHIVGYSMGGAIAQEIVLNWQERVATLTLVATFAKIDAWGIQLFQKFGPLDQSGVETELFRLISPLAFNWRNFQQTNFFDTLSKIISGKTPYQPTPGFARQLSAIVDHDTVSRLSQIKVPTLVVAGERDVAAPANNLLRISQLIPNAKFHLIQGATHQIPQNYAEDFNQILSFFLLDYPLVKEAGDKIQDIRQGENRF
jgi:pimeloyl-ACP methyl ester carboxylesterase